MIGIARRTKFLIFTIIYIFGCLLFEYTKFDKLIFLAAFVFLIVITNLIALYPGYSLKDTFYISFQPVVISVGTIAGLIFFPNLNEYFKLTLILASGFLLYISTLTNNLVIAEKIEDASLPLFRVGLIWTQILLIIQSIPLITIVYKLDLLFIYQSLIILLYFIAASFIYIHTLLLSRKNDAVSSREVLLIVTQMVYLPFLASISTSFMPAESFLRATFVTSIYMGMVGYSRNYIENSITRNLVVQYSLISLFFLIVLFIFNP
jgi:hypothetical protein